MFLGFATCPHCGREKIGVIATTVNSDPRLRTHLVPQVERECMGSRMIVAKKDIRDA